MQLLLLKLSMETYCVKCRTKTETVDMKLSTTKNNTLMLKGTCLECGCKKSAFVKKEYLTPQ